MFWHYLAIMAGGSIGAGLRFGLSKWIASAWGESFPWGTLVVNVSGSLIIGIIASVTGSEGRFIVSPYLREFLMLGVLGGYTTFSSFSLQTLQLAQQGQWLLAAANSIFSLLLCLLAVWLGFVLGNTFNAIR